MMDGRNHNSPWKKFALLCIAFLLTNITFVFAQENIFILNQNDFDTELEKAIKNNDELHIVTIIKSNRFKVKPCLLSLIDESLESDLTGDISSSQELLLGAQRVAMIFDSLFGEKSLINIVEDFNKWTLNEKREKFSADSLNKLATSYRRDRGRDDEALQLYEKAIDIYRRINDTYGQSIVYGGIGYIYFFYNTDSTLHYYDLAYRAREQMDDKQLMSASLNGIGLVYERFLNDYENALEYYSRAENIRKEIGDWNSLGTTLSYKASVYQKTGKFKEAIETFRLSYAVNEKGGDSYRMAEARLHSGTLLNYHGSFDEALDDLTAAMEIFKEINDSTGIGDAFTQISSVYVNLGDYTSAISACTESVNIMQAIGDEWGLAGAYNNMGWIYQSAKRLERSAEFYRLALEKYKSLEDTESVIIILNNLGTVAYDQGEYARAEEYHLMGLEQAREIEYTLLQMQCMVNLANDRNRLGKIDTALSNYNASLKMAETLNNPEGKWKALVGTAENYKIREEYDQAIKYNELALEIIEEIRSSMEQDEFKANYLARERYAYEDVITLFGKLDEMNPGDDYDQKAFELAEKCKARALLDLLSEQDIEGSEENLRKNTEPVLLKEFQNSCLDDNTCLIEYSTGDSCSWAWLVTIDNKLLVKLPPHDTIREQVELLRFTLQQPGDDNIDYFIQSGYRLFEMLIQPLAEKLKAFDNLVIVPDGILNYLPFEVLLTDNITDPAGTSFSDLPYMALKHSVSYAQSASVLFYLSETDKISKPGQLYETDLVAFGDPYYGEAEEAGYQGTDGLSRLINSAEEVKGIAGLFPEGRSKVFIRNSATEENFKTFNILSRCHYLHLATHGLMNDNNPELNSIVLAQDDDPVEDGLLQTSEIFNLKTNADLVVLSACQTGMGKMVRGEGVVGLTRAFMYAGAPSVMVSLWSVSDASTADLMKEFYRNIVVDDYTKSIALKKAKISMISSEQYAHPFYWAPFILVGNRN